MYYAGEQPMATVASFPDSARKKVAIIGGAATRTEAPWDDPSWEIWSFSSLRLPHPRITRWFEMHALGDLAGQLKKDTKRRWSFRIYLRFLQQLDCPVYMQHVCDVVPNSVAYPLQEALEAFGRCFTSTASYLLALAILEKYDVIGVWGIHLTEKTVYARQRPGVEYLLGVAKQRGIQIILPRGSPLRIPEHPVLTPTEVLYGYDWESPGAWWRWYRRRRRRRKPRRRLRLIQPRLVKSRLVKPRLVKPHRTGRG